MERLIEYLGGAEGESTIHKRAVQKGGGYDGMAAAGVAALNARIHLILVPYDPAQHFTMMNALITANRSGGLAPAARVRSARRLAGPAR